MNESSSKQSSSSLSTETPSSANAAAQAILARRSNDQIPLSLGKASLRMRLEAYYSLISPETLSNRTVWLRKYDQIYEKYGGTHQGEGKLAHKLAKKYGTAVRLLVVKPTEEKAGPSSSSDEPVKRDESWYRLRPEETASGVVDCLSSEFDPWAALVRASKDQVLAANPWMKETPTAASSPSRSVILDNLGKCASLLPADDPLRRDGHHTRQLLKTASASKHSGGMGLAVAPQDSSSKESKKRPRSLQSIHANTLHPFDAIASHLDAGPHSLLFRCKQERKRVKIVVRYVNMVRGTLSGTLVAFDKHMNMILRDVEEVYSPRLVNHDEEEHQRQSNLELEVERRRRVSLGNQPSCDRDRHRKPKASQPLDAKPQDPFADPAHQQHELPPGTWNVRKRQMKQLLVRGDMVVSIYVADQENRAVTTSRYSKRKAQS